ncbi:Zinc-finger domain of monoamine-oxidase A repressor R1 [Euphorbia peplus]|nr:Zinc-finger domain of monoamine-oxidase A repressor R1 [Euphorbia peplus]
MVSQRRKKDENGGGGSAYEEYRKQRIKANNERMVKLGILDLKSHLPPPPNSSRNVQKKLPKSLPLPHSSRRSSRLKTANPVNYSDFFPKTNKGSSKSKDLEIRIKQGSKPEIYDQSHQKLLRDCKTPWTSSMDEEYREDGKRIYDPEKGESCHQCRQKTLGLRTRCSSCETVQGQFCGGCLYTRYGESVIEVNMNPKWVCPVCRGICNCSRCRKANGWEPTGYIYSKVSQLGFKSVAHYLIQTRQAKTQPEAGAVAISDSEERELSSSNKELQLEAKMEEEETQICCSDATTHSDNVASNRKKSRVARKNGLTQSNV